MRTYHYRYPVRLEDQQRRFLETMLYTSGTRAKHYLVARTLLMSESSAKANPAPPMSRRSSRSPSAAAP
jgi:hypothetical protein